jgi:hypothetical protein
LSKIASKRTEDDFPAQSFQTLLKDLATIVKNRVRPKPPTPLQRRALDLLQVSLRV